eukprot:TRINITY_DN17290_c0_g1_i3.p1 TRINITY_DN17290_c0_g1~~TRINITY_DN17290_c0_g1_i3.p1  ORF type:complete len:431 (-),score=114.04 TRINITY_DN17290_c0_g1_i3:142-1434(-)
MTSPVSDAALAAEETCVNCSLSPLEVSLVLTCNHRLCLDCAALSLRRGRSGHEAQCPTCKTLTDVDPAAAKHLCDHAAQQQQQRQSHRPSLGGSPAGLSHRPPVAQAPTAPLSHELCGQCQAQPAELDCWQCGEQFCSRCAAAVHRAGRMKEHRLTPVVSNGGAVAGASPEPAGPFGGAAMGVREEHKGDFFKEPAASAPALSRCPDHPQEPGEFFCLDCESECICAECAIEAAQKGRQVMKVHKAYQMLAGDVDRALEALRGRSAEQQQIRKEAESLKSDLDLIICKGKQNIQEAFQQLRAALDKKETELLEGIDYAETTATQALAKQVEPLMAHSNALQEAQMSMRKIDASSDEVKALNNFAAAKVTVGNLVDPLNGVDGGGLMQLLGDLKGELRNALDIQTNRVGSIGVRVPQLRHPFRLRDEKGVV